MSNVIYCDNQMLATTNHYRFNTYAKPGLNLLVVYLKCRMYFNLLN